MKRASAGAEKNLEKMVIRNVRRFWVGSFFAVCRNFLTAQQDRGMKFDDNRVTF